MGLNQLRRVVLLASAFLLAATPASAHHVMGGKMPSTFVEGLLSGLGHPVIGPDHLAFMVAVGVIVGAGGLNLVLPLAFVAAMAVGVAVHVASLNIPAAEMMVALSVLLAGFLIARGRALPLLAWASLFAAAGLFHGYAFGESIFGAETSPLGAYLLGLAAIQAAITIGVALVARRMGAGVLQIGPRLVGAAIIGVGFTVLVGQLIPGV
jgi:urease accessory protein